MIKINRLDKYFNKGKPNEIHVINNTTLEFGDTGLVCILGESGSGKTTLLNTIGGLDTFQSGEIEIDGVRVTNVVSKENEKLRNLKFAYIFQEQHLLQDDTVAYNIRLVLNQYEISEAEKEARIDYVLQAVDMRKYKKRLVSQLSGGQQQRIAIARALVTSPDIILADEPTGSLDEANTMRIMSIIKKISKECLVILVTHERRIAEFFADRIIQIEDGRIARDTKHKSKHSYNYSDDTNLYLKEFEKDTLDMKNICISLYHQEDTPEMKLNVVYSEGTFYLQAADEARVVFLNSQSEMQMLEEKKPVLNMEQIEEFDYSLAKLPTGKEAHLPLREVYQLAKKNVSMLGKKQIFMVVTFIITAILLVYTLQGYLTAASVDKESVITEDSHYLFINAKRSTSASNTQYYESFDAIYRDFSDSEMAKDLYIDLNTDLSFRYESYGQIARKQNTLPEASYVTLDHLKEEDLILGRMPELRHEIVVDRWVLQTFLDNDILKSMMTMEDFLGLYLWTDYDTDYVQVVGICDTGEPTIYVDKYLGISLATWADKLASLEQLKQLIPGEYDSVTLAEGETLVNETTYQGLMAERTDVFTAKNGLQYKVAGVIPDDLNINYIVQEADYRQLLDRYICTNRKFMIYGEDNQASKDYFNLENKNYDSSYVEMLVADTYEEQMAAYREERSIQLNAQFIVTIVVFVVSMLMLYFTMKSNAISRAQELTVYRLAGISGKSILTAYVLEIILITNYTVLPVVLLLSGIVKFIAAIPSMQAYVVYPWSAMAGLLVFFYLINIMVGIIPVYRIMKLPPAQLAGKAGR